MILTDSDKAGIKADIERIIADNPTTITIRRGNTTLAAQTVRIERRGIGRGRWQVGQAQVEAQEGVVAMGTTTLDIQVDDRFTDGYGNLYRVRLVHPNRQVAIQAEAELVQ